MILSPNEQEAMAKATKRFGHYRTHPHGYLDFCLDYLDVRREYVWPKMEEIFVSVHENFKTSVRAGHSVSKSYSASRLALAFLLVHGPNATVLTTAPTGRQVEDILWREIHAAYKAAKAPLGGHLTRTKLDMDGAKWFAVGVSTSVDPGTGEASSLAGYHNDNILVLFDEASGIDPAFWRSTAGLLASGTVRRWLAVGNPLHAQTDFHRTFSNPQWHNIRVSCLDTPNYKRGEIVIPGLADREYVKGIALEHGEDSNEYRIRVLGEFPSQQEGAFWGLEMAKAEEQGRIGSVPWVKEVPVYAFWDTGDIYTAIIFVQFIDRDIRIIDSYFDTSGQGLPFYAKYVQNLPYPIQGHWAGADLWSTNKKSFQTGMLTVDLAGSLGIRFQAVQRHRFEDGVECLRALFSQIKIDKGHNADLIAAWTNYRKKKNALLSVPGKPAFHNAEVKDWTNHFADAGRHMAMVYRYQDINGRRLGSVTASEEGLLEALGININKTRRRDMYDDFDPYERA